MLDELQVAVTTVTERIGPATVTIGRDRRGTGVVIADGRVLTNAHNLRDRTTQVAFADERVAQAEVLGSDPEGDLAVLAVDTTGAPGADGPRAPAAAGQVVFGAAHGRQGLRVTFGVVSGVDREFHGPRGRRITGSVEHTAPLARGSSGGPLVDAEGRLLGINTSRVGDGFYLADPHRRRDSRPGRPTRRRPLAGPPPTRHRRGAVVRRPPPAALRRAPRARRLARAAASTRARRPRPVASRRAISSSPPTVSTSTLPTTCGRFSTR